jgi:DNA polymerase I-like protein with 3'-5' exonuclease and polymerase domains
LELSEREPLARLLLAYREACRKASTYGIDFLKHVHAATGRLHGDWHRLSPPAAA